VKRTREDEPPKARRGWQRGRGRPPKNGDEGAAAAAARKRSSRSVFGPSGEDRPDMLTDAETVVLPVWLHHRPSSAEGTTAENAAAFLKAIAVPAEPAEAPATEPETGETSATEPEAGAEAGAKAASPAGEAGTATGPPEDAPPKEPPGDAGEGEAEQAEPAEAKAAEADAEADAGAEAGAGADTTTQAGTEAGAEDQTVVMARPGTEAEPGTGADGQTQVTAKPGTETKAQAGTQGGAEGQTVVMARPGTKAGTEAGAGAQAEAGAETKAGADAQADASAEDAAGAGDKVGAEAVAEGRTAGTDAPPAGTDATPPVADATQPTAKRPDPEAIIRLSLADLQAAAFKAKRDQAKADQATADQAKTVPTTSGAAKNVEAKTLEAIEAIDALEAKTIDGLEARTAEAVETVEAIEAIEAIEVKTAEAIEAIEAMTANALEAIDATAAEIAAPVTGEPGQADTARPDRTDSSKPGRTDSAKPGRTDSAKPDRTDSAKPDRTEAAAPSAGTELTKPYVISIDEPPASVTLTTSATETTIAVPQPRAESTVAVTPAPAPAVASALTSVPQRIRPGKPAALPPAEPGPPAEPEAEPAHVTTRRRTRVSRALLLAILCLQAVLSLQLHNTAFEDEALYVYSGHMELQHLLHGAALQGQYASYFSGSPVLYPVAAGFLNGLGGLTAARMLSLAEMLSITALLYSMTRRLFNERIAVCAALLFSVCESAIFLGNFATYDATCLFLLACAAWIMVRTAGFRWPVFLMAAPVAALAVGVKYAGLLFVPTIAVLPALAGWPLRGRRVLLYPPVFVAAVVGLLYGALRLGGKAYMTAISSTTTNRVQGLTSVTTLLKESAEWGGVIFVLALIGTAAYVRRVRTEPEELIAPAGGRFRRLFLGLLLTGTALLAPAYQAHLHTDISFQKHIGFGLFFAAPIAGLGLARLLGDHFRRPHIAVGIWSLALVLGLVQTSHLYQVWPNSNQFVQAFSKYLKPHARYLVEVPEVPIYYLLGHPDAQPRQFTSTFYINYVNSKGVLLNGTVGFTAAVNAGYFHVVAYNGNVTAAADAVLAQALSASKDYYLAAEIHITDVFGPGDYFIWVKGHRPKPSGVFHHASPKYQDLGTKIRELAP
jgi:Dolichyl-phosphate-mannose-protein mannosyltransferase